MWNAMDVFWHHTSPRYRQVIADLSRAKYELTATPSTSRVLLRDSRDTRRPLHVCGCSGGGLKTSIPLKTVWARINFGACAKSCSCLLSRRSYTLLKCCCACTRECVGETVTLSPLICIYWCYFYFIQCGALFASRGFFFFYLQPIPEQP